MTCPHAPILASVPDTALCWPAMVPEAVWLDPRLYHLGNGGPAPECADLVMFYAPRLSRGWTLDVPAHLTVAFWDAMSLEDATDLLPPTVFGLPGGQCEDNTTDPFGGDTECRKDPLAELAGSISEDTDCDCDSCRHPF